MRPIGTKTHGYLDYIMGLVLIVAPWLFGFARGGAETWVPVIVGISVIIYSLVTSYEMGLYPLISMRTHLALDLAGGILMAVSPWLFGFAGYIWAPHLILGVAEIGASLLTKRNPTFTHRITRPHKPVF